ncbi:hypothetical protein AMECASPLE_012949 [Ameca splendens]|uniref:Uncharacterized protein n=1 Tax=Ameca splendens TaxID=208324 RepID=A0ABV0Y139_9TELE
MLQAVEFGLFGCIYTCHIWFALNEPEFVFPLGPDLTETEVVSVRFRKDPGVVRFWCEYKTCLNPTQLQDIQYMPFKLNKQVIMGKISSSVMLALLLHGCYKQ